MGRLDDCIDNANYVSASLILLKEILESGSCNDCKWHKKCKIAPKPGELVRYNCYIYEKGDINDKTYTE